MGLISDFLRKMDINHAISHLPSPEKEFQRTLMSVFTDERLSNANAASLQKHFHERRHLRERIHQLVYSPTPDEALATVMHFTEIMKSIIRLHATDGGNHMTALHRAPEIVLTYAESHRSHSEAKHLTVEQQKALMAVTFLTHQETDIEIDPFIPDYYSDEWRNSYATRLTRRIIEQPAGDIEAYAHEYLTRMELRWEFEEWLEMDLQHVDNICDYPDSLIERILDISMRRRDRYQEIVELAGRDEMSASVMGDFLDLTEHLLAANAPKFLYLALNAVDSHPQVKALSLGPAERREIRQALLNVTVAVHYLAMESETAPIRDHRLTDQRLVTLLCQHPQHSDSIINLLTQRNRYSFDEIHEVLGAGALGSGAL